MGSPETEWARGIENEEQRTVIFDQSFSIMQTEFTLGQWHSFGWPTPRTRPVDGDVSCLDENCPVQNLAWYEAVAVANEMSARASPPLPQCYNLADCTGEPGVDFTCASVKQTTSSIYDCVGYRLPTEAEWEYAARAGTQGAYFLGNNITRPERDFGACGIESAVHDVAWYCANSDGRPQPVGYKQANQWGLHDILGNVAEWTHNVHITWLPKGPVHNLGAELQDADAREIRGGAFYSWPSTLRVADRDGISPGSYIAGNGVRLARTIKP